MRTGVAVLFALVACGGGSGERPVLRPGAPTPQPTLRADASTGLDAAGPLPDAGPTLTEAQARALLAERFRAAGLRIRQDVPVGGVTLDGADPQKHIGYEYVAEGDVDAAPKADGWSILIIEATDVAQLTARVDAFLGELPRSESDR